MKFLALAAVSLSFLLSACRNEPSRQQAVSGAMDDWTYARFPSDLGPSLADVSDYPSEMKSNYRLFLAVCSACHSPARALNSTLVSEQDWKRYVHRMHVKIDRMGFVLTREQERAIVQFLVYDSKRRKVDQRAEFEMERMMMEQLYEDVRKEREKLVMEGTLNQPKRESPYVGVK